MITVTLVGLPEMGEDAKRSFYRNCVANLCLEKDFDLRHKDFVFEFSSSTRIYPNDERRIDVVVEGLSVKPGDGRIRNLFAHELGDNIKEWYPEIVVEVHVRSVDSEEGHWISDQKADPHRAVRQLERMLGPSAGVGDECLDYRRRD